MIQPPFIRSKGDRLKHMTKKPLISAVINVFNEAEALNRCLKSLQGFADEIIVVDMHSTDNSSQVALSFGARLFPYRWSVVVEPARNFALSKATGKWIILLDPDEYLGKTLKNELLRITRRSDVDYVKIPRKNIIFNKWIRHSNFWPDYLIRFFKKGFVSWNREVHSQPITKGNSLTLLDSEKLAIRHQNYPTVTDFVLKNLRYSDARANELEDSGYKIKVSDFLLRPIQEFNSRFFASEGYKDGFHGLILSLLQSFSIALTYIRLWEKQSSEDKNLSKESFVSACLESNFEFNHWLTRYVLSQIPTNPIKKFFFRIRQIVLRLTKNF